MTDLKLKALGLDSFFQGLGVFYILAFALALVFVLVRNKSNAARLGWGIVTVLVFAALPYRMFFYRSPEQKVRDAERAKQQAERKVLYHEAKPIFEKLCQESREPTIKRTVEDVEGILLLRVRPSVRKNFHTMLKDPMWQGAAFPSERTEDSGYAEQFLLDRVWISPKDNYQAGVRTRVGSQDFLHGFLFVDVPDEKNGGRLRITATEDKGHQQPPFWGIRFKREQVTGATPRYALTFEDNFDLALRRLWIAGSTLRVIDTKTNEAIAEQSFWRWDNGLGHDFGDGSLPWGRAMNCPTFESDPHLRFVDRVVRAKQRN